MINPITISLSATDCNKTPYQVSECGMDPSIKAFRGVVRRFADEWLSVGIPSREKLDEVARSLDRLRQQSSIPGIWEYRPILATATVDDGLGQGLTVIEVFAEAIGMQIIHLGLMKKPEEIIADCRRYHPDFLGLTVLQFDTEEELLLISESLPGHTRIVAGGPVFTSDPDFAKRTGTHYTAKNVADFLRFMLEMKADPKKMTWETT